MYDEIPKLNQKHVVKIVSVNSHPLTEDIFSSPSRLKDTKAPPIPLGPAVRKSKLPTAVGDRQQAEPNVTASGAVRFSNKVILNTVKYVVKCPPVNYKHRYGKWMKMAHLVR